MPASSALSPNVVKTGLDKIFAFVKKRKAKKKKVTKKRKKYE